MNEETKIPPAETGTSSSELIPLNIIRTETVLSKLPIHNLAKKGKVDISITRKNTSGEIDVRWEVSYSDRYGQPRQLGYKVDTIVINRRIDEAGRPLPELIRLGSLREIAQELGLGNDTPSIKKALIQNASAFINAKLKYTTNDKHERTLEAAFTRYSIIFTGDRFPDGSKADAVYIKLNGTYRDVLNNAPVRPLNYDYLRLLAPAAQRFYEVVSRSIFIALKFQRAEAKLHYSEYCTYSAQQRYFDYDHFKKQMYKIHRSHTASGYLKSVRYQEMRDAEGKIDWLMLYTPGPKAKVEFQTFTRSGRTIEMTTEGMKDEVQISDSRPPTVRRSPSRQKRFTFVPPTVEGVATASTVALNSELLAEFTRRGIAETRARELMFAAKEPELLLDQLEWGDEQIRRAGSGEIRNPAGFFIHLVSENILPPPGFETTRRRRLREEAQRAKANADYRRLLLEDAYRQYTVETVAHYIDVNHLEDEVARLTANHAETIRKQWRADAPATTVTEMAEQKARASIAEHIQPALMTFEAYCQSEQGQNIRPTTA